MLNKQSFRNLYNSLSGALEACNKFLVAAKSKAKGIYRQEIYGSAAVSEREILERKVLKSLGLHESLYKKINFNLSHLSDGDLHNARAEMLDNKMFERITNGMVIAVGGIGVGLIGAGFDEGAKVLIALGALYYIWNKPLVNRACSDVRSRFLDAVVNKEPFVILSESTKRPSQQPSVDPAP